MWKKIINTVLLSGALLLIICPPAMSNFYVVAGSRGIGTKIQSLPYTISNPGFYYIAKNLSCAAGNHGITIAADNVTIDLMGFTLTGPGNSGSSHGIYVEEQSNIEIRNGSIEEFAGSGVLINDEIGNLDQSDRILNIRCLNNNGNGLYIAASNSQIKSCSVSGNTLSGIVAGSYSTVEGCAVFDNHSTGISGSQGMSITGNTCADNGGNGIGAGSGSSIIGNTCDHNTLSGIDAHNGSTLSGNTCYQNQSDGITVEDGATVTGNTCYENTKDGINTNGGCTIESNTCHTNGDEGIQAGPSSTVINNTCRLNTGNGIYLEGNNLVDRNTAVGNGTDMNVCATCTFIINHTTAP